MTPGTEAIVDDFHRRLRAFVSRRVRNPADGADVVQETFLRVHRHLGAVRRADRLAAWVFQIARNAIAATIAAAGTIEDSPSRRRHRKPPRVQSPKSPGAWRSRRVSPR